ncbi:MAG TPA: hypothetical protein ENH82_01900 [bacterium]|nr:hypothetical protein [bacterium]
MKIFTKIKIFKICLVCGMMNCYLSYAQNDNVNTETKEYSKRFSVGFLGGINYPFFGLNDFSYEYHFPYNMYVAQYPADPSIGINFGFTIKTPSWKKIGFQSDFIYKIDRYQINLGNENMTIRNKLFEINPMLSVNLTNNISAFMGLYSSVSNESANSKDLHFSSAGINVGAMVLFNNGISIGIRQNYIGKSSVYITDYNDNAIKKDYKGNGFQVVAGYHFIFKKKVIAHEETPEPIIAQKATEIKTTEEEKQEEKLKETEEITEQKQLRGGGDPLKGLNISAAKKMEIGKYYALIVGIDNYKGVWQPLKNAVRDAKAVEKLLREKYKIDYFRTLENELATRKNIMKEFSWLVDNVTEKDNVFIYYSGHGEYQKQLNKGYWVPVEAETNEVYEFISNSTIQTFLNGIGSKHTLLVSDACFSGDLFRGTTVSVPFEQTSKYYTKVHSLKSRHALTSGGVEPVMDGGREGHSVFTYYFLEMLKRNEDKYYDVGQLYNDIKIPVTNNSEQTPILQPVKNTGDEGGQFIFIKK